MNEIILKYLPIFKDDLEEAYNYIIDVFKNKKAADDLVNAVEEAIVKRSKCPECFEKYDSLSERKYPYYRIYVKRYVIYYVVIPGNPQIMEIRRLIHNERDVNNILKKK